MRKLSRYRIGFLMILALLGPASAQAQNNRSAVSLSGTDAATCTVPDPCRTFGVAISKTNVGGEVIVLSSAGYGPFTVDKSVSIISPNAFHAALAPTSGEAITVNVDGAVVVLRGLTLNGSLGGSVGINFTGQTMSASGTRLYVENCVISGFASGGVSFGRNGTLFVKDSIVRQSVFGMFIDGSPGFPSRANIDHVFLEGNQFGLLIDNATVAVRDSVAAGNANEGFHARAVANGTTADLSADNCHATHNFNNGFMAGGGSGIARLMVSNSVASANSGFGIVADNNGTVRASNNTATRNSSGFGQAGTDVFESRGNNTLRGNVSSEKIGTIGTFTPE